MPTMTCPCGVRFEGPANKRYHARPCQVKYGDRSRRGGRGSLEGAATDRTTVHVVIPDTQAKPGVPNDHLDWIGRYICDTFGDRAGVTINLKVIHLGDHWDMPSLSSYDKGKQGMEGRRVRKDIDAGNRAFKVLARGFADVKCKRILLRGNHEERINRAVECDAQLDGLLSQDELESPGWEVIPFRQVKMIDGVGYAHYFENAMTGRPLAGANIETRLKSIGHSFTMGHQQTLGIALRFVAGRSQHGLVAGACYQHDEDYKGPQGNAHWRGIIVCHQVEQGSYDIMTVSLDYLCRRYEGHRLAVHQGKELVP